MQTRLIWVCLMKILRLTQTDVCSVSVSQVQSDHLTVHVNHGIQWSENLKINTKAYWHEFNREWNKLDGFIDGPSLKTVLASPNLSRVSICCLREIEILS